uniref:Uncharacterized protein n=1 Tax=Lepeophtheirus salmonis TaxID=72036 RepID=A0A0K2UZX5_LEPSM
MPVRERNTRSVKNIDTVSASIQDDPNLSLTRHSQTLGISVTPL